MSNAKGQVSDIKYCLFFAHTRTHTHTYAHVGPRIVWDIFMHTYVCVDVCADGAKGSPVTLISH